MTFAEIKELLNDGFTPEQITLLTTSGAVPTPAPEPAPETETVIPLPVDASGAYKDHTPSASSKALDPAPEQEKDPTPEPEKAPAPEPEPDKNKEIIDAIKDLKKTIQAGNILKNSIETVDPDNALEKAMAEIIRPSFDKNE